jgi:hypothetical protein
MYVRVFFHKTQGVYSYSFVDIKYIHIFYNKIEKIQFVIVPENVEINHKDPGGIVMNCNKCILSDSYNLYDITTIKKFNLHINADYVKNVSRLGRVDILEWLNEQELLTEYDECALTVASACNRVNVLEWWKQSKLPLKYDNGSIYFASRNGHVDVLTWWLNSGLSLKYDTKAFDYAVLEKQIKVLNWWLKSKLPLKFSYYARIYANIHVETLNWWNTSGLKLEMCS